MLWLIRLDWGRCSIFSHRYSAAEAAGLRGAALFSSALGCPPTTALRRTLLVLRHVLPPFLHFSCPLCNRVGVTPSSYKFVYYASACPKTTAHFSGASDAH